MNSTFTESSAVYLEKIRTTIETEGTALNEGMNILIAAGKTTKEEFITDVFNALNKNTDFGKIYESIDVWADDIASWLLFIRAEVKEQKEATSLKDFIVNEYREDQEILFENPQWISVVQDFKKYESPEYKFFLDENMDEILFELLSDGLLFSDIHPNEVGKKYAVDILMISPEEWNSDLSASAEFLDIYSSCVEKAQNLKSEDIPSLEKIEETYLGKLLIQQGYSFIDLVKNTFNEKTSERTFEKDSLFLKTFRNELDECYQGATGVFAMYASITSDEIYALFKDENNSLMIPPSVMAGFFDPQQGGGSLMGIEIERPVVFPVKDCTINLEKANRSNFYTIGDDVYGMSSSNLAEVKAVSAKEMAGTEDIENKKKTLMRIR